MAPHTWSFILVASCAAMVRKPPQIDASRRAALKTLASRRAALQTLAFTTLPRPAAAAPLDAALSLRADALRPLAGATCSAPATPPWLEGEYTVAASRFEGVSFPRGGAAPRQTAPGSRKGTLLLLPNVGANPRGYARAFDAALDGADARPRSPRRGASSSRSASRRRRASSATSRSASRGRGPPGTATTPSTAACARSSASPSSTTGTSPAPTSGPSWSWSTPSS